MILIDLEDGTAPEAKAAARAQVAAAVAARGFGPREVVVRINPPETEDGEADLAALAYGRAGRDPGAEGAHVPTR